MSNQSLFRTFFVGSTIVVLLSIIENIVYQPTNIYDIDDYLNYSGLQANTSF